MTSIIIYGAGGEQFPIEIELKDWSMLSWFIGALDVGARVIIPKGVIHLSGEVEILVKGPVE